MGLFKQKKEETPQDPLTPWEAYQARQAKAKAKPKQAQRLDLPQVTQIRKHHRARNLILLLTPLVLLLAMFGYLMSPLAKVGQLSVQGETTVPAQTIIDDSHLSADDLIVVLLAGHTDAASRLKQTLPQIKTVRLSVANFNQVTIHVKEYQPVGYLLTKGKYHVLLESGKVVAAGTDTPTNNYPVFTDFKASELKSIAAKIAAFPAAVRHAVSEVKATRGAANPYQITLTMTDGNTVVADSRTVAKRIKYYPSIIAQVKTTGTVDLEVGAFFTPYKNAKQKSK
ncbi:cell division protein FtsQ/DivIB [Lacticaseibacillus mingshuiensis]|uniref:Cell division protein DivIB n=1 Tax=Lacticaseibacillus mingshuiensis TaxID=2799574 RepID=A0ABW4CLU4_9LACO|nr:cell division protein FtsQ/DivIB [Lacticaseibacillus mingshuiensis]